MTEDQMFDPEAVGRVIGTLSFERDEARAVARELWRRFNLVPGVTFRDKQVLTGTPFDDLYPWLKGEPK